MSKINPSINLPTKNYSDQQWIAWYESAKNRYGRKDANFAFLELWKTRATKEANTGVLRDYMRRNGLELAADSLIGEIRDETMGALDSIGSVFKMGGYITAGIIGISVLGGILVVYNLTKNLDVNKAIGVAVKR